MENPIAAHFEADLEDLDAELSEMASLPESNDEDAPPYGFHSPGFQGCVPLT